ncbi:MAG: inositol monophosphatase [Prevotella sp.]|nr:inositol monophosphatase [Prevotella sp.]
MQKITKFLCGIIQQAAKITNKSFNVYAKDNFGDIVTDIDKDVESFLIEKLNHKYPEFDIISEEFNPDRNTKSQGDKPYLNDKYFIIDPIDGTKNFAVGIPLWGIQIAAMEGGEVISAAIYLPKLNELYYADCDGAFLNGEHLEISPNHQAHTPVYAVEGGDEFPLLMQMKKDVGYCYRRMGASSVFLAWVAAGRLSGYFLRNQKVWDFTPGMYLVKMAGGYTNDDPIYHVAATNEKMFETLSGLPTLYQKATANNESKSMATVKPKTKTSQAGKTTKSANKKSKEI